MLVQTATIETIMAPFDPRWFIYDWGKRQPMRLGQEKLLSTSQGEK